jgi:hypothetical protein
LHPGHIVVRNTKYRHSYRHLFHDEVQIDSIDAEHSRQRCQEKEQEMLIQESFSLVTFPHRHSDGAQMFCFCLSTAGCPA